MSSIIWNRHFYVKRITFSLLASLYWIFHYYIRVAFSGIDRGKVIGFSGSVFMFTLLWCVAVFCVYVHAGVVCSCFLCLCSRCCDA